MSGRELEPVESSQGWQLIFILQEPVLGVVSGVERRGCGMLARDWGIAASGEVMLEVDPFQRSWVCGRAWRLFHLWEDMWKMDVLVMVQESVAWTIQEV